MHTDQVGWGAARAARFFLGLNRSALYFLFWSQKSIHITEKSQKKCSSTEKHSLRKNCRGSQTTENVKHIFL